MGLMPAAYGSPITEEDIRAAVEMAVDRETLLDQKGRWWGRWWAGCVAAVKKCAKCGRLIDHGYMLLPHGNVHLCAKHVEHKWV